MQQCAQQHVLLCAIVENYQTDDGIIVPEVLKPLMPKSMLHLFLNFTFD